MLERWGELDLGAVPVSVTAFQDDDQRCRRGFAKAGA
jgi:hypothetical protein